MTFNIGITATRNGLTDKQRREFKRELRKLRAEHRHVTFRHGDCVGGDEDGHNVARELDVDWIVIHPPIDEELRAFCKGDEVLNPFTYLKRNRDIVDASDVLFVCPLQMTHQTYGGTWYTNDYAIRRNIPVIRILPAGTVERV